MDQIVTKSLSPAPDSEVLLEVKNLKTYFYMQSGDVVKAVDGVDFSLRKGSVLGIIGESGSGKSVTSRSILRIVDEPGKIVDGEIFFRGRNLLKMSEKEMRQIRGAQISLIFQDPTTSFNPYTKIGEQLSEAYRVHRRDNKAIVKTHVIDALKMVGISNYEDVLDRYPCEFSAGFRQRIFIAMSMIFNPALLIADEPTTNLGITIQAEIIEALIEVKERVGNSVIIITHDFGVVSQFSDDIMVMYAGHCVEYSPKRDLLLTPKHPYTVGLIQSVPLLEARKTRRLKSIPGFPPDMVHVPQGCPFAPRCLYKQEKCSQELPLLQDLGASRKVACHYPLYNYHTSDDLKIGQGEPDEHADSGNTKS
ncbi:MAG: peptide ABC transporter ATP-binding protein [Anaerolineales bacterium]|nr:MAG: peptide ABC transporter ATP-binding protein [Anaerolineales bacterium]